VEEDQSLVWGRFDSDVQIRQEEGCPVRLIERQGVGQSRVFGHRAMLPWLIGIGARVAADAVAPKRMSVLRLRDLPAQMVRPS
jgi:hypothetical protein